MKKYFFNLAHLAINGSLSYFRRLLVTVSMTSHSARCALDCFAPLAMTKNAKFQEVTVTGKALTVTVIAMNTRRRKLKNSFHRKSFRRLRIFYKQLFLFVFFFLFAFFDEVVQSVAECFCCQRFARNFDEVFVICF